MMFEVAEKQNLESTEHTAGQNEHSNEDPDPEEPKVERAGTEEDARIQHQKDVTEGDEGPPKDVDDINSFARKRGFFFSWKNVNMAVQKSIGCCESKKQSDAMKEILSNVSGSVHPYQLTAIMGHSGAGKSSLLNVLSGRTHSSSHVNLSYDIRLDGDVFVPSSSENRRKIAFVAQHDTLLATATPREAIWFSARMRLLNSVSDDQVHALTNDLIDKLALTHCANTKIGLGLSGGEMRRVSLGIELVVQPSMIFLDEMTSGLDSHNALQVLKVLKSISKWCGASVLFTIHQPNSDMFNMIDHLILLHEGHCMYEGSTEAVAEYFSERGEKVPPKYNVPDWILTVSQSASSVEELVEAGYFKDFPVEDGRNEIRYGLRRGLSVYELFDDRKRISFWRQSWLLFVRDMRNFFRDYVSAIVRFASVAFGGAAIAIVYSGIADQDDISSVSSLSSHAGAVFLAIFSIVFAVQVKIFNILDARPVLQREFLTDHYRLISYGLGDLLFDCFQTVTVTLTFLVVIFWAVGFQSRFMYTWAIFVLFSCVMQSVGILLTVLTNNPKHAGELMPLVFLPQTLLAGYFVFVDDLSPWIRWLAYLMPLTYAFRLFLGEEFSFCKEESDSIELVNCVKTVGNSNLDPSERSFTDFLGEHSTLTLPQTGIYVSKSGVEQYLLNVYSPNEESNTVLARNTCALEGTVRVVDASATADQCSITTGYVQGFDHNEKLTNDGKEAQEIAIGLRIKYRQSKQFEVDEIGLFFGGNAAVRAVFRDELNATLVSAFICETIDVRCPGVYLENNFVDRNDCIALMQSLERLDEDDDGHVHADGNTTGCRAIHAALAWENPSHCPHLSYFPMKDSDGLLKCHKSYNLTDESVFSPAEINNFLGIGATYGLLNVTSESKKSSDRGKCTADFAADFRSAFTSYAPLDVYCLLYLEQHGALGEHNLTYWMVLLGMLVVIRVFALVLLRVRLLN